jgi:hypothetical protein
MNPVDCKVLGEAVCASLAAEIHKLGFPAESLPMLPDYDKAGFSLAKDPYSGLESLCGVWRDAQGFRLGEMKFHGDGSFYAEYDVVRQHPSKPLWFVESVLAWGRDGVIKSEAKLLEVPA